MTAAGRHADLFSAHAALVRRFYESWSKQDLEQVLECAHPEMVFDWSGSASPFRGVYRGHEELARFWAEVWDAWEEFTIELEDVVDCTGERLVAVTNVRARGRGSGIEIAARGAMLWAIRDGKTLRGKLFQTRDEALAAAGA